MISAEIEHLYCPVYLNKQKILKSLSKSLHLEQIIFFYFSKTVKLVPIIVYKGRKKKRSNNNPRLVKYGERLGSRSNFSVFSYLMNCDISVV